MTQPTMQDILNMTPEQQKEFQRKAEKRIITFVALKVAVSIGTVVAIKAVVRQIEKAEQAANK